MPIETYPFGDTPVSGQTAVAVTNTAVAVSAFEGGHDLTVTALAANAAPVYLGPSTVTTGTGLQLAAGQSVKLPARCLPNLWVNGTAGDKVSWLLVR